MAEGARWSVMQRSDLYFSEWFLSDTSSSWIPHGVSASSEQEQDSHHSIANSENIRNSSIVTLRSHLFLEWGISQMPSMSERFLTSDHDSRSSSMSSTSLVNLISRHSKIRTFQDSKNDTSLTGSLEKILMHTKNSISVVLLLWWRMHGKSSRYSV